MGQDYISLYLSEVRRNILMETYFKTAHCRISCVPAGLCQSLSGIVYQEYDFPLILSTQCIILWDHAWLLWHSLPHHQQEELQEGNNLQKQKESGETLSSYFNKYTSAKRIKRKKTNCVHSGTISIMILLFFFSKAQNLKIFRQMT